MEFDALLENFNTRLWTWHVKVPEAVAKAFAEGNDRRVVCTLNGSVEFQCAIMPAGEGVFFINLNKQLRDKLKLKEGSRVRVSLCKDESEFGLPMPQELDELLQMDEEGRRLFMALTPGKKRNLLYITGQPKTPDGRLRRAVIVVDHLRKMGGKINFKLLNEALKA
jgi:hypothetical protein